MMIKQIAIAVSGLCLITSAVPKKNKPNLVFIFSDQQTFDMLGCYGNQQIKTPNLDEFSKQGIRFTHCFSNSPICTPFRGMLMSGQQTLYNGTFVNDKPLVPGHGKKFAEVLRDAGYNTAYIGKWHLQGGDRDRPIPKGEMRYGFDEVFESNNCHVDFRAGHCFYWNEEGQKVYFNKWEVYGQTDQALEYLESRKGTTKPFALFVSWHPPHDWGKFQGEDGLMHYKYDAPDELMAMYNRDSIKMRPGLKNTADRRRMVHGQMAMASGVDIAFGQLMEKLRKLKLDKNTIVVFTSDHGDMLEFDDAIYPKQYPHDYSCHIPFMIRWPGEIEPASKTGLLFSALDMMPSILGLMDLDVPKECHGKNLAKAILTHDENAVDYIPIWLYEGKGYRGVITRDYTWSTQKGATEGSLHSVLFDRKNDPYQLKNLFADPKMAAVREKLWKLTQEWMAKYNDHFWEYADFMKAATDAQWNNSPYIRPVDVLKCLQVRKWTELRSEFANPSLKYRPVPLWFWNNTEVTRQGIEYQLKAMRDSCGYGGVSILPFGKEFRPEYLTDAYFDLYRFVINKASDLGMRVCIYDEYGFPSGSGGWRNGDGRSRFGEKYPELLLKGLEKLEFVVDSGKVCKLPVKSKGKIMGIVAMEQDKLDCVDISSSLRDSVVTWKVPKGKWRIMVFSCSYSGVPIADYLSEEATGKFISMTHQEYYDKFSKFFGNTVYGTFFDEPTLYHANGRVWTEGYNLKFEHKYGFSPVKYYPALWYNIGDKTAAARNLLFGFRTELYAQGFTKTIDDWNRNIGIVATGHQDNEEVENPVGTSGDLMKCFKYLEAPGIDKIFGNRPAEKFYKVVASSAYNWDKSIVMSETYGGMGISIDSMYSVAMDQYAKGINELILHAYWYNNEKEKVTYLPELSERNPIYKKDLPAFSKYLSRLNLLLQNDGSFIADAAVLYPINQMQAEHYFDGPLSAYKGGVAIPKSDYVEVGRLLSDEMGINYMFLHPEILDEKCTVSGNHLTLQGKLHPQSLRVIIVPSCRTILLSNLRKIKEFFDQGGSVIFTSQLPEKSAELGQDKEVQAIMKQLIQESGMTKNKKGGIAIFIPEVNNESIAAALNNSNLTCFLKFENNHPLRYLHKKIDGKSLVFITNPGKTEFSGYILLQDNKNYEMWNPYSGTVEVAESKNETTGVRIFLKLEPGKSIFVIEK